jgi:peptidoglycan/xylan/chitin deacetylase (PgdA/CDA1 family)
MPTAEQSMLSKAGSFLESARDGGDIYSGSLGTKAALAELLFRCGLFRMQVQAHTRLIIFNYHRIRATGAAPSPFNNALFGPTEVVFDEQVKWLVEHTRVLSEQELIAALHGDRLPAGRCSMITFDDGYCDNYELAWPILKKYNAPATFFIASGLTDARKLGWWDLIAYLVKRSTLHEIIFDGERYITHADRSPLIAAFVNKMGALPAEQTNDLVERLADACDVQLPSPEVQSRELMTWEQIREIATGGGVIGSHTHTHPVLSRLSGTEQQRELGISREVLRSKTGMDIFSLAYPVGTYAHFTSETKKIAVACGYSVAYSFGTGTNGWPCDALDVKRISAPQRLSFLAAKASLPAIFGRR